MKDMNLVELITHTLHASGGPGKAMVPQVNERGGRVNLEGFIFVEDSNRVLVRCAPMCGRYGK